jgi:molybdenum cofactor biosynthesis enzyme MoaA
MGNGRSSKEGLFFMSFDTVDLLTGNVFQVSWDLGRRCNYDCSYCPVHRHDNFSPHATLDELKANTNFLFEYIDTYMEYRKNKYTAISFTGGEPTVNPHFVPFVIYLKDEYKKRYSDKWTATFSLTTNGAMGKKMADNVMKHFTHATVSYHSESNQKLKQQVKDRIMQFHKEGPANNFTVSVNVMFHAAYFDECKELCDFLHENGVKYVPRVIGEEAGSASDFAHQYTEEQLDYMKNYWKYKNAKLNDEKEISHKLSAVGEPTNEETKVAEAVPVLKPKKDGYAIGRPCCGSREMCLSAKGEDRKSTFVDFRNFKGWHCSVNWFFLHLEQQTDQVFHHQTCQAKFDQTRGPIGKISEGYKIIADLKQRLESKTMPTVICPKATCGCGLCAPKSAYKENYKDVLYNHIDSSVFENSMDEVAKAPPIIPTENN